MLNRAVVQPDPVVAIGLAADTMASAADAESLDDLFLRLEAAGVMLRIDTGRHAHDGQDADPRHVGARSAPHHRARRPPRPHQARDRQRDRPRRRGRFHSPRTRSWCTARRPDCSTHRWSPCGDRTRSDSRRSRAGFPCFNAALAGYVEATRDDDRERNRLCPAQHPAQPPGRLGVDAGAWNPGDPQLRRRARHRRLGQRLRAEPGPRPAGAARRIRRCRPPPPAWPSTLSAGWPASSSSASSREPDQSAASSLTITAPATSISSSLISPSPSRSTPMASTTAMASGTPSPSTSIAVV